jgi:prepilin-type N-terminal cleavage/methylation domain-containing protein
VNRSKAVTLIELVIVIVVVGIIASASSFYLREVINTWNYLSFRDEVVSVSRQALFRMDRDIRQVNNSSSVFAASGTVLNFTDTQGRSISYTFSGTNVTRNGQVLVSGVKAFNFSYYNRTNGLIASPIVAPGATNICRIRVNMTVESRSQNKTVGISVYPRNIAE